MSHRKNYRLGMIGAIGSSTLWGVLPVYWKQLDPIPSNIIIFYRIFLVGLVTFVISVKRFGFNEILNNLRNRNLMKRYLVIGLIITINWSIYIWAVNAGYIVQTSIGYFIEPLCVCLLGVLFFQERLSKFSLLSILLASVGLGILVFSYGQFPVIAFAIGISFATYAAMKKKVNMDPVMSLFLETVLLMPISLVVVIFMEATGQGALVVASPYQITMLLMVGFFTALPLGLFGLGAKNLPMITLGITTYISPSLALILGILVYNEPFNKVSFIAFFILWIGLIFFTVGEYKNNKENKL